MQGGIPVEAPSLFTACVRHPPISAATHRRKHRQPDAETTYASGWRRRWQSRHRRDNELRWLNHSSSPNVVDGPELFAGRHRPARAAFTMARNGSTSTELIPLGEHRTLTRRSVGTGPAHRDRPCRSPSRSVTTPLTDRVDYILAATRAQPSRLRTCHPDRERAPCRSRATRGGRSCRRLGPSTGAAVGSAGDDHWSAKAGGGGDCVDVDDARQRASGEQRCLAEVRGDRHRRWKKALAIGLLDLLADKAVTAAIDEHRVDDRCRQHAGFDPISDDLDDRGRSRTGLDGNRRCRQSRRSDQPRDRVHRLDPVDIVLAVTAVTTTGGRGRRTSSGRRPDRLHPAGRGRRWRGRRVEWRPTRH